MTPQTVRRGRIHALILAVVLWVLAGGFLLTGSGPRNGYDRLKGADFIQFYTYAHLARTRAAETFYDPAAYYQAQIDLVPESSDQRYLPVYPPQIGVMFLPLSGLNYLPAMYAYTVFLLLASGLLLACAWSPFRNLLPDVPLLFFAMAAFPPFYSLVIHGQTTIVAMAAFVCCWMALRRRRSFVAGLALGLLAVKPQFVAVPAAVFLIRRKWQLLAGMAISIALQIAIAALVIGPEVLTGYGGVVARLAEWRVWLEPRPDQLHSMAALVRGWPSALAVPSLALASVAVVWTTARIWRSPAPLSMKMSVLILGTLLVNPHVISYDVAVLAFPVIWTAAWVASNAQRRSSIGLRLWWLGYALYGTLAVPTALFLPVQLSVVVLLVVFGLLATRLIAGDTTPSRPQAGTAA